MFTKIKTFLRDKVLFNPWIFVFSSIAYFVILGPLLISAPSTAAVLAGLAGGVAVIYWLYKASQHVANKLNK